MVDVCHYCPVQISSKRATDWCSGKTMTHFETSAKQAVNVESAFQDVAKKALALDSNVDLYNDFPDKIQLNSDRVDQRDGCSC